MRWNGCCDRAQSSHCLACHSCSAYDEFGCMYVSVKCVCVCESVSVSGCGLWGMISFHSQTDGGWRMSTYIAKYTSAQMDYCTLQFDIHWLKNTRERWASESKMKLKLLMERPCMPRLKWKRIRVNWVSVSYSAAQQHLVIESLRPADRQTDSSNGPLISKCVVSSLYLKISDWNG